MIGFWILLIVAIIGVILSMFLPGIEGTGWASVFFGVWTTFWLCIVWLRLKD